MQTHDAHVRLAENAAHELVRTKACKSISVREAPPPLPILAHPLAWQESAPIKIQKAQYPQAFRRVLPPKSPTRFPEEALYSPSCGIAVMDYDLGVARPAIGVLSMQPVIFDPLLSQSRNPL